MRARWIGLLLSATMLSACSERPAPPALNAEQLGSTRSGGSFVYEEIVPGQKVNPDDNFRILVDTVEMIAPAGTISNNPDFWNLASKGSWNSNVLQWNDLRVGTMSAAEWEAARAALGGVSDVRSRRSTLSGAARNELALHNVPSQTIFRFDENGELHGRTYEQSENFWGVSFAHDKSFPDHVILRVAPVVRSERREIRVRRSGSEYQFEYAQADTQLDVGINTGLPLGSVLVIAPTPQAQKSQTSIGRAFLVTDDQGRLTESVLFIYPRLYRYSASATAAEIEKAERELKRAQKEEDRARRKQQEKQKN